METAKMNYLALGDSYTIGEAVPEEQNFPNQLWKLCVSEGIGMAKPHIIAKTGWTTDELAAAIKDATTGHTLLTRYELVTLLIGVNNQYRGRDVTNYAEEFVSLLRTALGFVSGNNEQVIVLSIPDWGVTPFAHDRDRQQIAMEIDAYNETARIICQRNGVQYIYITGLTREAQYDPLLLATDGLHPSGREYERWSRKILPCIKKIYRR